MAGRKASSCADCLAWGVLNSGRRCSSCSVWRHKHPGEAGCAGCGRILAVKDGYCRLCWQQARCQSRVAGGLPRGAVSVLQDGGRLHWHQLFFDRMQLRRPNSPVRRHGRRGASAKPPPEPAGRPAFHWVQARLFEAWRDFTRFDEERDADLGNPWLAWGLYLAWQRGESRGWRRGLRFAVRRTLIIVLSRHQPGDTVRYSEIIPLQQALGVRAGRTAEVLQEMGVLDDDRRLSFEDWLERKLDGLAPGIRADTEAWLRILRDGGPRSRPRGIASAWNHMLCVRPVLLEWSSRYGHLREVTRDDVLVVLGELHGSRRSNVLVALRSLFAFCKKQKAIFRSPVQGIRVGERTWGIIQPLSQEEAGQAAEAAATPGARLLLVLAAMHAARVKAIREIRLDDAGLGNRRIVIGGQARPLDDLTRQILLEWLTHRGARWPSTASPHLLASQQSANGTGPVSRSYFATTALRGKAATLESLRADRQLQEALAFGPARCTWHQCSGSTPRPRSATRKTPGSCSSQRPRSKIPAPARPRTVDTRQEGEERMAGPGGDTLAIVAETLAGLSAAARAGSLDDTAALAALSAARSVAAEFERSELALTEAARDGGATWTRIAAAMGARNRQTAQKRHADLARRHPRPPAVDTPAAQVPEEKALVNEGALPKSTTRPPHDGPANESGRTRLPSAVAVPAAPRKRSAVPKITDAIIAESRYQLVRAPDHAETRAWHVLVGGRPAGWVRPTWRGERSRPGWEPAGLSGLALPVKGTAAGNARTRDAAAVGLLRALQHQQEHERRKAAR